MGLYLPRVYDLPLESHFLFISETSGVFILLHNELVYRIHTEWLVGGIFPMRSTTSMCSFFAHYSSTISYKSVAVWGIAGFLLPSFPPLLLLEFNRCLSSSECSFTPVILPSIGIAQVEVVLVGVSCTLLCVT